MKTIHHVITFEFMSFEIESNLYVSGNIVYSIYYTDGTQETICNNEKPSHCSYETLYDFIDEHYNTNNETWTANPSGIEQRETLYI